MSKVQLIDTHCHIHEANYPLDIGDVLARAHHAGVGQMICVGTSLASSREAVEFASQHEGVYASIGVHPHDTKEGWEELKKLLLPFSVSGLPYATPELGHLSSQQVDPRLVSAKSTSLHSAELALLKQSSNGQEVLPVETGSLDNVALAGGQAQSTQARGEGIGERNGALPRPTVAVGEIGLDYFYTHSPRAVQIEALEGQIELALKYDLPIIFHVREAFDDFWPIFDNFSGIRGELHSFTDTKHNLEEGLKRGLYVGVNGISTFTKDTAQQEMFSMVPLEKMLLETDAPFLTPVPMRGRINEPAFVRHVAELHAHARGVSLEEIAAATTANARALFALS